MSCANPLSGQTPLGQTGRSDTLSVGKMQRRAAPGSGAWAVTQRHSGVRMSGLSRHSPGTYSGHLHLHSWGVKSPKTHRSCLIFLVHALSQPSSQPSPITGSLSVTLRIMTQVSPLLFTNVVIQRTFVKKRKLFAQKKTFSIVYLTSNQTIKRMGRNQNENVVGTKPDKIFH